eukprot:757270-Hanusia_phi.AAC.1
MVKQTLYQSVPAEQRQNRTIFVKIPVRVLHPPLELTEVINHKQAAWQLTRAGAKRDRRGERREERSSEETIEQRNYIKMQSTEQWRVQQLRNAVDGNRWTEERSGGKSHERRNSVHKSYGRMRACK